MFRIKVIPSRLLIQTSQQNPNPPHMDSSKKSNGSKYLPSGAGPATGLADGQSNSEMHPKKPSRKQKPRLVDKAKSFLSQFLSPKKERVNNATNQPTVMSSSQLLTFPASDLARPHSSYSKTTSLQIPGPSPMRPHTACAETSTLQTHGPSPPTARDDMTAGVKVTAMSSGNHGPPSSYDVQDSSFVSVGASVIAPLHSQSEPIGHINSENAAPPSIFAHPIPTSTCQVQGLAEGDVHVTLPTTGPDIIEPSPHSSIVWAQALKIAEKKLSDNNLPLDLTNLTSRPAEKNIEAVIKTLKTLQEDDKKNRWSYTWRGKKVIVVERLGTILKSAGKYSKVVDTAVQSNPQVSALVWAGVCALMQVCISRTVFTKFY